jgi:hypothetical protein
MAVRQTVYLPLKPSKFLDIVRNRVFDFNWWLIRKTEHWIRKHIANFESRLVIFYSTILGCEINVLLAIFVVNSTLFVFEESLFVKSEWIKLLRLIAVCSMAWQSATHRCLCREHHSEDH